MSKALSVREPWAWAIIFGGKDVENRTWKTPYRGRIWIHASSSIDRQRSTSGHDPIDLLKSAGDAAVLRAFIGSVNLVDIVRNHPSSWASSRPEMYHWVLANPIPLDEPIPANGQLNLWTPPTDLGLPDFG